MKRKLTCTNYFIILEKNFSREHTEKPNAIVQARSDVTFWAVGYHSPHPPPPPSQSQLAFHIYYVKYENTLTCKRISWDLGGGGMMFLKKISISYMYNTKSDHFSPKIKPYVYGNRKSNAKS